MNLPEHAMNRRAAAIGKSDDQPAWKVRNNVGNRGIGNTRFFREGDTAAIFSSRLAIVSTPVNARFSRDEPDV